MTTSRYIRKMSALTMENTHLQFMIPMEMVYVAAMARARIPSSLMGSR
jgi:hypothetical protein